MRKIPSKRNSIVQSSYVGFPGELTIDSDTLAVKVHDGSTTRGVSITGAVPSTITADVLNIKVEITQNYNANKALYGL